VHRFIQIDGVHNFRDFGGYDTQKGKKVKKGKLFRAGQFANLTDSGRANFGAFEPKTIIDLRRAKEREEQPSNFGDLTLRRLQGLDEHDDGGALPPHMAYLRDDEVTYDATFAHMVDTYRNIPFIDQHKYLFRETFLALANGDEPIVIHCAAGKDRTGVLCALILRTLEVDDETIEEDYLLTNKIPYLDKIIKGYAEKLGERFGRTFPVEATWPMGAVYAEYLKAAFEAIAARHETTLDYLAMIGVNQGDIAKLHANLLE
jgi:protein-tyrosine phosphatase